MLRTNEATDTDLKVIEQLHQLGWKRRVSFGEGLKKTLDFFSKTHD